ncbi:hypothetical protein MKW98_015908 [Papaver atlanticum]|uniref:Integrator complex subunit 3 N-terminal domain-containing protein n=1 Tax=Papaver atlanticum TaxID=357466 RepID=A0AAD4SU35_9MAGN|nr:hypothetical protein MKW98_015908 [Papaver atlanticum]
MASKLFHISPHHAESQIEISLREAFQLLETQLRPPFSLKIPSPSYETKFNWATSKLVEVPSIGIDNLLAGWLRQIVGGDISDGNLWVCIELLKLCLDKFKILLEDPLILTSALFTYFQLFAYCCRLSGNQKLENLKRLEIDFCVGLDLVRLFQDLVYVSEFRAIWKDLLSNPLEFQNSRDFARDGTQLRFLLTHVRWGHQKLHQESFARKFFCRDEGESVICDIVSYWQVTQKLALFYDWLFFDERTDNVLNIEPGILLVMNLVPRYIDMTWTLVEFIFY